jgi:hypothetical protein
MEVQKTEATFRTFFIEDEGLNKIMMVQTEKRITLYLVLKAESGRKRKIGVITKSTRTLFIERSRSKHLFRKLEAYGLNYYVLSAGKSFDTVCIKDEIDEWKIPKDHIFKNGKAIDGNPLLSYIGKGFELQIFIPLKSIEQFKVKHEDNSRF